MNLLTNHILEGLLPEENKKIIALYGGGFKPPIGGHFEVVEEALKKYPEINEFIILVGSGERNGISQAESILIWDIYKNYLPQKVTIQPSKAPIGDIYRFAKDNPQDVIYWVLGRREGADDDNQDIVSRAKGLEKDPEKYSNLNIKIITTQDEGMRGRNSRAAAKKGKAYFTPFLPKVLSKEEKEEVYNLVVDKLSENNPEDGKSSPYGSGYNKLDENATYSKDIDYKQMIADLTDYMVKKGRNIEPLPKVEFIDGDLENAKEFLGKTAYYDPNTQTIVLYTEGRHPKDIVRSFSHEMVHHTQFLEDRLEDIQTTDTTKDDNLDQIEQEANLVGTMTFRNWTDSINEKKNKDPFGLNAYALELARGLEEAINEGPQFGVLYHFTEFLSDILDDDRLRGPISLTRSLDSYAAEWLGDQPYFILDKDKLRTKYKIRPFKDTSDNPDYEEISQYDEMEEVIDTDIINLSKYIIKVVLPYSNEEWEDALKEKGIPYKIGKPLNEADPKKGSDKKYTIYSDMDGVLVDFNERFKRFSGGIPPKDYEDKYGKEKFWDLIDKETGVRFWVGMPWMSDGKQLWDYIKTYNPTLLSSPSRSNSSRMGKRIWRKRNLPSTKLVLAQASKKQNYANPDSILIDDRVSNIDQWVKAGGIGILHTDTVSTINKLKELGL